MRVLKILLVPLCLPVLALLALEFAPPAWLGPTVAGLVRDRTDVPVQLEELDLHVFTLEPEVRIRSLDVPTEPEPLAMGVDGEASVSLVSAMRGELRFPRIALRDAEITVYRSADGEGNWEQLLPESQAEAVDDTSDDEPITLPIIEQLSIDNVAITALDEISVFTSSLTLNASGSMVESTQDEAVPLSIEAAGFIQSNGGTEWPLSVALTTDEPVQSLQHPVSVRLDAQLDTLDLRVQSELEAAPAIDDLPELELALTGDSLDAIVDLFDVQLPDVPNFSLDTAVIADSIEEDTTWTLRRFDAVLGDSVFEGDVRVAPTTVPPQLYANVIFTALDFDEFLAIAVGEGVETASEDEIEDEIVAGSGAWFPDQPLGLSALIDVFEGAVDLNIQQIESDYPIDGLTAVARLDKTGVTVDPMTVEVAAGVVSGTLELSSPDEQPEANLSVDIKQVQLQQLLDVFGIDSGGSEAGTLGGRARFWAQGDDIASLAGSLDGGVFVLMDGGKLLAILNELTTLDVVETLTLLLDPEEVRTDIDCAYIDLQARTGVVDISRFVIDTADAVYIADGEINLGAQTLDVSLEPHAKDVSLFSGQSAVTIEGGAEAGYSVVPGPELITRAGLAALLASVASPAAALLPFVQLGQGEGSEYCDGLVESMEEAR